MRKQDVEIDSQNGLISRSDRLKNQCICPAELTMFFLNKRIPPSPVIITALVILLLTSGIAHADREKEDFQGELSRLRVEFADKVNHTGDQEELCALALIYAGRIWHASARELAGRRRMGVILAALESTENEFEKRIKEHPRPLDKQLAALHLLYDSVKGTVVTLAALRNDKACLDEIEKFDKNIKKRTAEANGRHFQSVEAMTQGVLGILALAGQNIPGKVQPFPQIEKELKQVMENERRIEKRKDIHARAKYFLRAINNMTGCFKLVCLLGLAIDESAFPEYDSIRKSWKKNTGPSASTARSWAVTLTALAEASAPLVSALNSR